MQNFYQGRFAVAPMLDWTTKHCRVWHRQFSKFALLYTEMVTTQAIKFAKYDLLEWDENQGAVALQLGGCDAKDLAYCAKLGQAKGFAQINLNVGCPSSRVQNGQFGAILMGLPQMVQDGIKAMQDAVTIPVTVKHRLGIDEFDSYQFVYDFVAMLEPYCNEFIVHARKAWLNGLSPKENRSIPKINYDFVYRLKKDFPHLKISINGEITTLEQSLEHLNFVDGVMIGREAFSNPSILGSVDRLIFNEKTTDISPIQAIEKMLPYIEQELQKGIFLKYIIQPMIGAFKNCKGAKQWRQYLSENAYKAGADLKILENALKFVI